MKPAILVASSNMAKPLSTVAPVVLVWPSLTPGLPAVDSLLGLVSLPPHPISRKPKFVLTSHCIPVPIASVFAPINAVTSPDGTT